MARTVRDADLGTRAARLRLKPRGKPFYRAIDHGLHIGYRRTSGRWVVRVYVGLQNYKVETIGTADDVTDADGVAVLNWSQAQEKARLRRVEFTTGSAPVKGPYTVGNAIDDYLIWLEHEGRSEQTIRDTRGAARAHIVPKLGGLRVDQITTAQIKSWLMGVAKAPPRLRVAAGEKQRHRNIDPGDEEVRRQRRSSANRVLTYLKAALNHAWRSNRVASDKAWRAVQPFKGADASRARYLQIDECRRLVAACESGDQDDFGMLLQGGLHTGARFSELARLTPNDFNQDVGTIAVRKSKSGKPRHVVLTDEGRSFFADLVKRAGNRQLLFVRADGEAWRKSWQVRPMKAACRAANISAAGFHILRHTWASHAVMNGVPLLVVARNLGHKDTRMVEKHYGHLAPSYEADAIRAGAPRFGIAGVPAITAKGQP